MYIKLDLKKPILIRFSVVVFFKPNFIFFFLFLFAGDVVLKDLQLKAEALNALKLPVVVKAGFVGTITLKVKFCGTDAWPCLFCYHII